MNHGQSNSAMATRTETTHGLTYSMARAIDILNRMAICLCHLSLLPDSRCLCPSLWTPTSSHNSAKEATGVIKFWGPRAIGAPPGPILPVGWGSRPELGAPHTFLTDSSVRLQDGRSVSVCQCLSVSSAIKQVPNMPNHQCIMEETEKESRFTNCDIFA